MDRRGVVILGAGGHAKSCIDVIEMQNEFRIVGLVGYKNEINTKIFGYDVIASDESLKNLSNLYQQAYLGNKDSDYPGVDIWQYFNEQINTDLDSKYNNKILVLTDGYFDFEDH